MDQLQSDIWLTASSNMGKYLRISSYIRKAFLIYDFVTAPLWISYIWGKFDFLFYQCTSSRQSHKQTPSEMFYVILLINLNTVAVYELKIKYPKRVALVTKYSKTSSLTDDFFLLSVFLLGIAKIIAPWEPMWVFSSWILNLFPKKEDAYIFHVWGK